MPGKNAELENRFKYHEPDSQDKVEKHEFIRDRCKDLAYVIDSV